MPLPAILDTAQTYLFADADKMASAGLSKVTIAHIIRLRDAYDYWLAHPSKPQREIVARLKSCGNINKSQAYADLRVVKELLGCLSRESKEYKSYRFNTMILASYDRASAANDVKSMVSAAATYARYNSIDKDEDDRAVEMPVQPFEVTDDPTVAGFKPIPNVREKIKKMKEQYWNDDVVDIEFEDIESGDDLFIADRNG